MKTNLAIKFFILITALIWTNISFPLNLNKYPELRQIADQLIAEGLYTNEEIEQLFSNVQFKPQVVEAFERPAEKLTWAKYRDLFVTEKVIHDGTLFWNRHQGVLSRASQEYGVPEEIIVAIIGVETRFGKSKGSFPVIESLSTLAVDFERRKAFFQAELLSFLKLAKTDGIDPVSSLGSYAGAMGIPQFIASSYHIYAVDFDSDGRRDLINSYADAIGSVANYFKQHDWVQGLPVKAKINNINADQLSQFKQSAKTAQHSVSKIIQTGVEIEGDFDHSLAADIIELEGKKGKQYELVFDNFYVIKRYNQSNLYAMAVAELSQAIKARIQS